MEELPYWKVFEATGKVEDYLRYKDESASEYKQKDESLIAGEAYTWEKLSQ